MKTVFVILTSLACFGSALAQNVTMGNGQVVAAKKIRCAKGMLIVTIELPVTVPGQPASIGEVGYPLAQVQKVDFPQPQLLATASALIAEGKAREALEQLTSLVDYFEPLRNLPGNWWSEAVVLKMQALALMDRGEDAGSYAEQIVQFSKNPEAVRTARVYSAARLAQKGDHTKAIEAYDGLAKESKNPQILAATALYKGRSLLAQSQWEEALLSLLAVPVLYPTQRFLMPQVLLASSEAFAELGDFPRARQAIEELGSKYPKSVQAGQAKEALEKVGKLEAARAPSR